MSDTINEGKTLETITKERDEFKASSDASDRILQGLRAALGIDKTDDPIEAVARLQEANPDNLPKLEKPEEEGARAFGRISSEERFVHVEEVSFKGDVGYGYDQIERRSKSAVERCLKGIGNAEGGVVAGVLPDFDTSRVLRVILEVK